MVLLNSIESVLTIIIIIGTGYYLTWKKWFNEETSRTFAKLVTNVSLPAYMLYNIRESFNRNDLEGFAKGLWVPFAAIFICYLIAVAVSRILNIDKSRRGTFQSMFFNSNSIFIGLPVNMALFGSESLPYVLLYYMANTTFFWTLGVYCINSDSCDEEKNSSGGGLLKRIMTPPLMGFIIALILMLLDINLPKFVMDTSKYLGSLTTPLSMLFIGISINSVKIRCVKFDKYISGVLLGRFIISPLIMFIFLSFVDLPLMMKQVFIIQAAMPVMTNAPIIAKAYGSDSTYAAVMVTVSTILSMAAIPVYMMLIQHI
ncbi:MAG: AEC family transporter [Clostridiaceae bacterium]